MFRGHFLQFRYQNLPAVPIWTVPERDCFVNVCPLPGIYLYEEDAREIFEGLHS